LIRLAYGAIALCLMPAATRAQNPAVDDLKGKIFDARMTKQTFANGLKFCSELDGNHFYFQPRDRVLALEDYHRSLESLARQQAFNPEKRRPWTDQDAAERWEQVKQQAVTDKDNCALVARLPELERELEDLEKKSPPAETKK
jgi:tRNA nucleotidyltransferase/poly(A) polymerase